MLTYDEIEIYDANYNAKQNKRFYFWKYVMGYKPNLAIPLIMSGYCDNAFFQTKMSCYWDNAFTQAVMTNTECVIAGSRGELISVDDMISLTKIKEIELMCTMYEYTRFVYASIISRTPIMQHLKYALQKNRVVQQMSRGRLILALKHYFKEGPYYPVDDTNSIYGKEYRKAMVRLGNK